MSPVCPTEKNPAWSNDPLVYDRGRPVRLRVPIDAVERDWLTGDPTIAPSTQNVMKNPSA